MEARSYCLQVARTCGVSDAPVVASRRLEKQGFAAVRLVIEHPSREKTAPLEVSDGFLASVSLKGGYHRQRWQDGRSTPLQPPTSGPSTSLTDLTRSNEACFFSPVDCIQFYYPRPALELVAESNELSRPPGLQSPTSILFADPTLELLSSSLVSAFASPEEASLLFVDHVLSASALHFLVRHCGVQSGLQLKRGGLSPFKQKKVLEMLDANLGGDVSIQDLADLCGLSPRHFTRAFSQSNGMSPYKWVMMRRIERAKALLLSTVMSIDEIARLTSFANQSHFTRMFTQIVGESPAAWRHARCV